MINVADRAPRLTPYNLRLKYTQSGFDLDNKRNLVFVFQELSQSECYEFSFMDKVILIGFIVF